MNTTTKRKAGRPSGKTAVGEIERDVKAGYEAFCKKHGLAFGPRRKWGAQAIPRRAER